MRPFACVEQVDHPVRADRTVNGPPGIVGISDFVDRTPVQRDEGSVNERDGWLSR